MKELIALFHYADPQQFSIDWDLANRELGESFPVWKRFLELQKNAGRGPGGSNEAWVGTSTDNNGIERWHETMKNKALALGHFAGHPSLLHCTELICELFCDMNLLMESFTEGFDRPLFFERNELFLRSLASDADEASLPYRALLEKTKGQREHAYMTSLHDDIKTVSPVEFQDMSSLARTSLDAWKQLQRVYSVSPDHCTCPQFQTYAICKHSTALRMFVECNLPTHESSPFRSPHANVHPSLLSPVNPRTPMADLTNTPKDHQGKEWKSPNTLWYRPQERPLNTWQLRHKS